MEEIGTSTRRRARALAGLAIAAQAAFAVAWVVAGALDDGYSHLDSGVSVLAARDAETPWIVRAGIVTLGLGLAALAPALRAILPRRRARAVLVGLFAAIGALVVATGVLPVDCDLAETACRDRWEAGALSWEHDAHLWAGLAVQVLLMATPFALARALWPGPVALAILGGAVFGVGLSALTFAGWEAVEADGLVQRLGLAVVHAWAIFLAACVLDATRGPRLAEPAPLRPRDFLAGAWAGEGILLLRPEALWRRVAPRFAASRRVRWLSDDVFVVDDEARFAGGHVERRRAWCEVVAPDRVHCTRDDVPDGAEMVLDERGYRLSEYTLLSPVGPLRIPLRARDTLRVEPDGTLVDDIELRMLGVRVARIVVRARQERAADAAPAASAAGSSAS